MRNYLSASGSKPSGHEITSCIGTIAASSKKLATILFPSPTYTHLRFSICPKCSRAVRASATIWIVLSVPKLSGHQLLQRREGIVIIQWEHLMGFAIPGTGGYSQSAHWWQVHESTWPAREDLHVQRVVPWGCHCMLTILGQRHKVPRAFQSAHDSTSGKGISQGSQRHLFALSHTYICMPTWIESGSR